MVVWTWAQIELTFEPKTSPLGFSADKSDRCVSVLGLLQLKLALGRDNQTEQVTLQPPSPKLRCVTRSERLDYCLQSNAGRTEHLGYDPLQNDIYNGTLTKQIIRAEQAFIEPREPNE